MRKKTTLLLVLQLLFCAVNCQSQAYVIDGDATASDGWMSKQDSVVLQSMKLYYKKPKRFKEAPGTECFYKVKNSPRLAAILACEHLQLQANDQHFIAFITLPKHLTKEDADVWKKLFANFEYDLNRAHRYQIRATILQSQGKDPSLKGENANFDWTPYVSYYSLANAKHIFNADTAISFRLLTLDSTESYKEQYRYLDALFLQKNGRGYVNFYCFYDEEGKKNLKKYWKAIEGVLRFEN